MKKNDKTTADKQIDKNKIAVDKLINDTIEKRIEAEFKKKNISYKKVR